MVKEQGGLVGGHACNSCACVDLNHYNFFMIFMSDITVLCLMGQYWS